MKSAAQAELIETAPGVVMKKVRRKSPVPIYGIGAVWVVYALLFPLYRMSDFLIAAVLSAGVWFLLERLFPGKTELAPAEAPPVSTGDTLADQLLTDGRAQLQKLRELNQAIPEPEVSRKIDRMTEIAGKILAFVRENPQKAGTVRKFLNYYLPTMTDLLASYVRMDRQEVAGKNISGAMTEIERIMDTVIPAFEKQLDALFQDEALDAAGDIEVRSTMLVQGGLTGRYSAPKV